MARKGTDGSLLDSLPWTLAALAVAILPHLPYLPLWITAVFIGCAGLRLWIERRRWRLPGVILRMGLALLCFIGVLFVYRTISGVGPGSALLTVMAALKLLETRRRRDQYVLLFLSIFLIMSSLLREQYVWSLPYMIAGVAMTMTAWLQMSVTSGSRARLAFGNSLRLIALSTPLMFAMWIFFPRIATPFWAVPIDTSSGVTGLSDEMSPGDISALSQSDAVAFRVRFDGSPPPPERRYWRGLVLHRFNGRRWSGNDPSLGTRDMYAIDYLGDPVRYKVTLEPTRQHWVFALDLPYEWSLDMTYMGPQQQLSRIQEIDQRVTYEAVSYPEYRLVPEPDAQIRRWYTPLPDDSNPRTLALAREMRARVMSDAGYVDTVMRMFSEQEFYYTLEPPALGRSPVDEFLFETRQGFCEHYASAFTVLMRAGGVPARVVVGYQGGQLNPMTGNDYMIVRQSDAHAWTEVWLEGRGWTRVDPTAAVAPERIRSGMAAARFDDAGARWGLTAPTMLMFRLELAWDMINAKWNEWVLAYGPENQQSFMEWLGMSNPTLRKMLLTLVALVALMLAGVTAILAWRYRPPRRDDAYRLYRRFCSKAGVELRLGEPPLSFMERVARQHPANARSTEAIVRLYLEARYGAGGEQHLEALRSAVAGYAPGKAA